MGTAIDYESENKDYAIQLDVEKGIVRKLKIVGQTGKYDALDVASEAEKMDFVPMVTTRTFANGDRLKSKGKMRSTTAAETIRQRQGLAEVDTEKTKAAKKKRENTSPRRSAGVNLEELGLNPGLTEEVTVNNGQSASVGQ